MLKKFPSDRIKVTKNAPFLCASSNSSVLLLICDTYTTWSIWFISLNLVWDFPFSITSRFYQTLHFCSIKSMDSLTLTRDNSFQNKNSRTATHSFASRSLIFKLQQEVWKFNDICVSWSSSKTNFLNFKNWSFELVTFSQQ